MPAPGEGPLPAYDSGLFDRVVAEVLDLGGDLLDAGKRLFGFRRVGDTILEERFNDLYRYYSNPELRRELQDQVLAALRPHLDSGDRIMLIAHSMGSIVAYDALRRLEREDPGAVIDHFVTIGAPLGLPHVKYKLRQEHDLVRTPSNVRRWTNYADRLDPVVLDAYLGDDYAPSDSLVEAEDTLVLNSYVTPTGARDFHKSYGYLRTPELSAAVRRFIA